MNDEQLITALRGLDRPVVPDPAFGERLYGDLRVWRAPGPAPRLHLVLVAALLAVAFMAAALVVGSGAFQPQRVVTDATTPMPAPSDATTALPAPSDRPYLIEIPEGVTPKSSPDDVEHTIARANVLTPPFSFSGIQAMRWFPGGEVPVFSGSIRSDVPVWTVLIIGTDGRRLEMVVEDGTRAFAHVAEESEGSVAETTTPLIPQATRDPSVPLRFEAPDGRTITPRLIGPPDDITNFGRLVPAGNQIWFFPRHRLYRIDTRTNEITRVELSDGIASPVAGLDVLWVDGSGSRLLAVDPETGEVIRSLDASGLGGVLGEDADGLWVSHQDGIELRDPETGRLLRHIESREDKDAAPYGGIGQMPAFGSLWDVDRGTGDVHRIDPVTGDIVASIPIGADESCGPLDPEPLRGLDGVPDLISACKGTVLIDPATNSVVQRFLEPRRGFVANGAWWSFEGPSSGDGWREPGRFVRFDPTSDTILDEFQLNYERTVAGEPVVIGDTLWFSVGERGGEGKMFSRNTALARIPLSELPD